MNIVKKLRENLSDNELKYVTHYLKYGNKLKAYEATFPDSTENESNPYGFHNRISVSEYIKAYQENELKKAELNKEWVLGMLSKNAKIGQEGWDTPQGHKHDLSSSNRATELIGKDLGMFTNEITINGISEVVKELKDKADDIAAQMASEDDEKE